MCEREHGRTCGYTALASRSTKHSSNSIACISFRTFDSLSFNDIAEKWLLNSGEESREGALVILVAAGLNSLGFPDISHIKPYCLLYLSDRMRHSTACHAGAIKSSPQARLVTKKMHTEVRGCKSWRSQFHASKSIRVRGWNNNTNNK